MSIEKIKERIKMIEDNDFTTNEIISEDINLNRDEIGKFLDPKNNLVVKAASKGFANTNKVASAHAELFSGGLKFSSDNKVKALPQNIQNLLKPIFNEMENLGVLPNDLTPNNYIPKSGYVIGYKGNRLILDEENEISLQFTGRKLDVLDTMFIVNVGNFNQNNFNTLYNNLNNNKGNFNIKNIKLNGRNTIQIEF
jgi:hypothetical protein